jgi:hypothetical protein
MQPYKGYFVSGTARYDRPFGSLWSPAGSVLKSGQSTSIIEVVRWNLPSFTMSMKDLAEWFGFELSKLVVDECLSRR